MGTAGRPREQNRPRHVFAERMRERRHHLKITQRELARAARVSHSYISRLEVGTEQNPSYRIMAQIAEAIGIELAITSDSNPEAVTAKQFQMMREENGELRQRIFNLVRRLDQIDSVDVNVAEAIQSAIRYAQGLPFDHPQSNQQR